MRKPPLTATGSAPPRRGPAGSAALAATLAALLPLAAPALAQDEVPEGEELALLRFRDHDRDGNGSVSVSEAELMAFGELAFVSMDVDESGGVGEAEFVSWGWGHESLAREGNQMQAYRTSQRMVTDILDRDNDGAVTPAEMQEGLASSFAYADLDGDGALTQDEYLQGLIFNIALKNALTADAG